jgi:hypothetical protein
MCQEHTGSLNFRSILEARIYNNEGSVMMMTTYLLDYVKQNM